MSNASIDSLKALMEGIRTSTLSAADFWEQKRTALVQHIEAEMHKQTEAVVDVFPELRGASAYSRFGDIPAVQRLIDHAPVNMRTAESDFITYLDKTAPDELKLLEEVELLFHKQTGIMSSTLAPIVLPADQMIDEPGKGRRFKGDSMLFRRQIDWEKLDKKQLDVLQKSPEFRAIQARYLEATGTELKGVQEWHQITQNKFDVHFARGLERVEALEKEFSRITRTAVQTVEASPVGHLLRAERGNAELLLALEELPEGKAFVWERGLFAQSPAQLAENPLVNPRALLDAKAEEPIGKFREALLRQAERLWLLDGRQINPDVFIRARLSQITPNAEVVEALTPILGNILDKKVLSEHYMHLEQAPRIMAELDAELPELLEGFEKAYGKPPPITQTGKILSDWETQGKQAQTHTATETVANKPAPTKAAPSHSWKFWTPEFWAKSAPTGRKIAVAAGATAVLGGVAYASQATRQPKQAETEQWASRVQNTESASRSHP